MMSFMRYPVYLMPQWPLSTQASMREEGRSEGVRVGRVRGRGVSVRRGSYREGVECTYGKKGR